MWSHCGFRRPEVRDNAAAMVLEKKGSGEFGFVWTERER